MLLSLQCLLPLFHSLWFPGLSILTKVVVAVAAQSVHLNEIKYFAKGLSFELGTRWVLGRAPA